MTTRGRQRRRGKEGRGHRGLKREVCRAQLFPIQCGAVFANTLNESERRRKGGDWLADWRAESSSAAAAEYKSFASRRDRCCVFHWVFYLRKIYLSAAKTNLNNKKITSSGKNGCSTHVQHLSRTSNSSRHGLFLSLTVTGGVLAAGEYKLMYPLAALFFHY